MVKQSRQANQALLNDLLNGSANTDVASSSIVLAEYKSLQDEVLKRLEFRYQLLNLILIVAGTFLTIGLQKDNPASILLVYPVLSLFLTASWAHNGAAIVRIGKYIQEQLSVNNGFGWYEWKQTPQSVVSGFLGKVSGSGLIITTQLLAVGLALLKSSFTIIDIVLLVCSLIAITLTIFLLRYSARFWN